MSEQQQKKNKKDSGKKGVPEFLPPELRKFAKQLGLDLHGLEPEAQAIWNHLESLSTENPVEYERFIAEQMSAAKEQEASKTESKGRSFRPKAEFVIETKTSEGDGSKVRELTDAGKTLYINICSSELIEVPKDKFGASLDDSRSVADGLEVPLLIGPVRPLGEEANAIDVIFNPIVPKICKAERYFRGQILELAQQWILEETPLRFKKNQYEDISDVEYKGGLGDKKDIPVLFNVDESLEKVDPPENPSASKSSSKDKSKSATLDEAIQNSHQKNDKKTISKDDSKNILSNPSSLLKELQKDQNTSTIGELKTLSTTKKGSIPSSKDKKDDKSDPPIKKAPAIVELDKDKKPIITSVEPPKEEKKKQSVSFAPASASAATNFDIQERPKNVPSKIEQKAIADLLDQFENPDAITLPDHESEDLSASIINELSKMLVGGSNPSLPVPAPPAPALATAPPTKPAQVAPPAPKPAPAQQSVPAQPSIPQSVAISSSKCSSVSTPPPSQLLVVYFNNNSPEIAPVAYKNDEENAVLTVEISGMKSTATLESLVLEASGQEIKIQSNLNLFEKALIGTKEALKVNLRLNPMKVIQKENVKAAWKKKTQKLIITVPYSR